MAGEGVSSTSGKLAVTIVSPNGQQYYAPYEDLSLDVISLLMYRNIQVEFEVDRTRHEGRSRHGPRFYARRVTLKGGEFNETISL